MNFLKAVSSHEKFTKEHDPNIEAALKNSMERGRWNNKNKYKHMSKSHTDMSKSRKYHVRSVEDLVRLIRTAVARMLIGGGGSVYSYIHVLPD